MNKSFISKFLIAAFLAFSINETHAQDKSQGDDPSQVDLAEKDGKEAEAFIQKLGDQGIETLTGKSLSQTERRARFEKMFVKAFDYKRIGKFVLGRFRRDIKPNDMATYLDLFRGMVVRVYASRFGEYNDEKFNVYASRIIDKKVDTAIVSSKIIRKNDSKVAIEWHIYKDKSNQYKIFDVVVEGVSMALTQRSEFASILQNSGIDGLIKQLKERKINPPPVATKKAG